MRVSRMSVPYLFVASTNLTSAFGTSGLSESPAEKFSKDPWLAQSPFTASDEPASIDSLPPWAISTRPTSVSVTIEETIVTPSPVAVPSALSTIKVPSSSA